MPSPSQPRSLSHALAQYQALFLASRNFAANTRASYTADLRDLLRFLAHACGVQSAPAVTPAHLEAYLAELDRRQLTGSTRQRRVYAIRSFFTFLATQGIIPRNPAEQLVPPKRTERQPRALTEAEYQRLQLAVAHETRDAAIIELLLQTGMRRAELARLTLQDIQLPPKVSKDPKQVGWVRLLGKGDKEALVPINWKACKALQAYLAIRPTVDDPAVFITKFGKPLGIRSIGNIVRKYLQAAGIPHASTHTLRHTTATQLLKKSGNIEAVRRLLRHRSLSTTQIYLDVVQDTLARELQEHAL